MSPSTDWTRGAAKWAAVGVLGTASVLGMAWSINTRRSAPWAHEQNPRSIEISAGEIAGHEASLKQPSLKSPIEPVRDVAGANPGTIGATPTEPAFEQIPGDGDSPAELKLTPAKIDLNTADRAQLELLPGIGPALADRIIAYRAAHGRFKTIEGLDAVKGLGPKTIEKLRPLLTVE